MKRGIFATATSIYTTLGRRVLLRSKSRKDRIDFLCRPTGIVAFQDRLAVLDPDNHRVRIVDHHRLVRDYRLEHPAHLAISPTGKLFISSSESEFIRVMNIHTCQVEDMIEIPGVASNLAYDVVRDQLLIPTHHTLFAYQQHRLASLPITPVVAAHTKILVMPEPNVLEIWSDLTKVERRFTFDSEMTIEAAATHGEQVWLLTRYQGRSELLQLRTDEWKPTPFRRCREYRIEGEYDNWWKDQI